MFATALHHPRRLFLRRALFQVHLWLGVLLSIYVALVGLSGSIIVFEDELRSIGNSGLHFDPAHQAAPQQVLAAAQQAYPAESPTFLSFPGRDLPAYTLYLRNAQNVRRTVLADATDGHLLNLPPHRLLDGIHEFHVYLLAGRTGFVVNCCAGIALVVLTLTGALLWWPGTRLWRRGLRIHTSKNWRRINYDTHNVVGIVTLAIVSFWGLSCVDFLWPRQTAAVIGWVSPLQGMQEPQAPKAGAATPTSGSHPMPQAEVLSRVVDQVRTLDPHGFLSGLGFPAYKSGNLVAYVDTRAPGDYSHRDIQTFRATDGRLLTTWHYGENHTLGDWLLWIVEPLHFGTLWGTPVKVAWALLGLSLPILSVSGLLMYWNRYLRRHLPR